MKKHTRVPAIALMVASMCGSLAAQVSQTAPPPSGITAPGPQAHRPPSGRPQQAPGTSAPPPISGLIVGQGSIVGYVYWDSKSITHAPANSCAGLGATVSVGTPSKGSPTFEQFKSLGTYHNFTYLGNVGSFAVCQYSIQQVPTGQDLQVLINFKPVFTPQVLVSVPPTANDPNGPIKIPGGSCNNLPPAVPSASVLGSAWWTCGNSAYNVNFVLQPANAGNMMSGGNQITIVSGAPQGGANPGQNQTNPGMLSGSNQSRGMLAPGVTPSPAQMSANTGSKTAQSNRLRSPQGNARVASTLMAAKQSSKITNPKAALQNSAIIAVLQKQSQNAAAEASAMKLGLRPPGVQTGGAPARTMAATGVGARGIAPAPNQNSALASSMKHPVLGAALPAQFNTLALTCSHDPSMRALTVSGGPTPAIFTPDPKYNFYTITGCSFGSPGTNSKAYIYYQGTFREDFQIQQWTDNFIQLSLDQNISGVDDQNNVTLIIQRDDGKQWTKNSYKFYAARQTVLLSSIPRSDFSLNKFRPDNAVVSSWTPTYTSASSPSVIPNLPGLSAEVHWDITRDPKGALVGGQDNYDFSHLHSTFSLDSTSMEWRDVSCTDPNYNQFAASKNNWSIDWYGNSSVQVSWQGQICNNTWRSCGTGWPVKSDCFELAPESNYGVNVWVSGPRGLDPWTGKPLG
jgi:hypothetical protein